MASTTRTASRLANNGTAIGGAMGARTDVLQSAAQLTTILVMSILTPVLCMKIFLKRYFGGSCSQEDYALFCAWFAIMVYCGTTLLMAHHGGGNHESEVTASDLILFQKLLYANTILYGPAAFLSKTSLLLILTRVFTHARRAVLIIYVFIGAMACYYVPILVLKIIICTPIQGLWDPSVDSKCFNQQTIFFADAIVSVATGAVVLLLPVPLVYTLKVNWFKRFRIAALLGVGGLSTIASVWRLLLVLSPNAYEDITVTLVRINLLGIAEVGIGILSACLPTFNLLLTRYANVRRTPSPMGEFMGNPLPETNMKRLTGMNLWQAGHKYGVNLGKDVDGVGSGNKGGGDYSDGKSIDEELAQLKRQEMSEAGSINGDLRSISDGDGLGLGNEEQDGRSHEEKRAETPAIELKLSDIETKNVAEINMVLEKQKQKQKQRQRREAEVPDWPLPLRTKSVVSSTAVSSTVVPSTVDENSV